MRRLCILLFILYSSLLCLFTSCQTGKTETEYIPLDMDLTDVIDPVLMQRPDNSLIQVKPGPILELIDVVRNSESYLYAWEMWEDYADLLESTLIVIRDDLRSK